MSSPPLPTPAAATVHPLPSSSCCASASSASSPPDYYFFQSPYLSKELEQCLRDPDRLALLAARGVARNGVHRLRRGDLQVSWLMDERRRHVLSRDNDRALNAGGRNSFMHATATAAANVDGSAPLAAVPILPTPTRPLLLYWTDGAKRTLPFMMLKAIALRRGAARLGLPPPPEQPPWPSAASPSSSPSSSTLSPSPSPPPAAAHIVPDRIVRILGGSNALDVRLLDDKCRMQHLLAGKSYVPHTESFDVTKEGWDTLLARSFDQAAADAPASPASPAPPTSSSTHACTPSCLARFLILKPSLGHKQHGILILPRCARHLPQALSHCRALERPGGLKGCYETWVVQEYLMQPLTVSGMDLGLLYEEGEEMKQRRGEGWKRMLTTSASSARIVERKEKSGGTTKTTTHRTVATSSPEPDDLSSPGSDSSPLAATSPSSPPGASAVSPTPLASPSPSPSVAPIRHRLTPSHPFLPSDSGSPLLAYGLYKVHFRVYAMVTLDADAHGGRGEWKTYWCNLSKVYHATEHMARVERQHERKEGAGGADACSVDSFNAAASYLFAQSACASSSPPATPFPPLSSLPPSCVSLGPSFSSPSLRPAEAVSKHLAMRLAHHVFPAQALGGMLGQMGQIVAESVRECVDKGGLGPGGHFGRKRETADEAGSTDPDSPASSPLAPAPPLSPGLASRYFQFLGYDFLWDTVSSRPLLLEVNGNVGQGLMSQEVMASQLEPETRERYGLSNAQYGRMREYWRRHFRQPFVEGAMRVNLDGEGQRDGLAPLPAFPEQPRLPSSPPSPLDQCWVLADVYSRKTPAGVGSTSTNT